MTILIVFAVVIAVLLAGIPIFAALGLTAAGILLTATAGSLRILQLRRRTRKVTRG